MLVSVSRAEGSVESHFYGGVEGENSDLITGCFHGKVRQDSHALSKGNMYHSRTCLAGGPLSRCQLVPVNGGSPAHPSICVVQFYISLSSVLTKFRDFKPTAAAI